jgi:hypothetical protein
MRILLTSHGLKAISADNSTLIEPARTYDTITNALTGALYFAFNKYSVEVEQQPVLVNGVDPALNDPPSAAVDGVEFATSDYNVENLYDRRDDPFDGCDFTGNPGCPGVVPPFDYVPVSEPVYQAHLADLAEQIAGPMHAPDLLMIQEAEDQDICAVIAGAMDCGVTNNRDGKPDTLQELAIAILAAGGPLYDTAYDRNGADDRGIVSAFLFRTDTVELLPADADDVVLGDAPTIDYRGTPLAYNTDVSNPKAVNADLPDDVELDTGFDGTNVYTRPPQVGHFRIWRDGIGTSVFTDLYAISNHFSSTPDARVGQRTEQAAYNAAIIEALLDAGATRVISGGDFNVYPRPDDPFAPGQAYACNPLPCAVGPSDQLGPMYDAGLHNLWDTLVTQVPRSAYSYNFVGQVQTLDMQFATDGQFDDLVQVRAAHLNADFAADYDGDAARGASDHDPQVARWFTDVTTDRLRALVGYFVETGEVVQTKADLLPATWRRQIASWRGGRWGPTWTSWPHLATRPRSSSRRSCRRRRPRRWRARPIGWPPSSRELEPASAAHEPAQPDDDQEHGQQDGGIAVLQLELGHEEEVHAVDPGDQGRDHEQDGDRRQALHDLVQVVGRDRLVGVQGGGHQVAVQVERVEDPDEVVVEVLVVGERLVVEDLDLASEQRVRDVAHRSQHPAQLEELALQVEDLAQEDGVAPPLENPVLQPVDVLGDLVEQREIAVDRRVDDRVQEPAGGRTNGRGPVLEAVPDRLDDRGSAPVDAHQEAGSGEQVQLAEVELAHRVGRREWLVGDDHVVPGVGVHLRALAAFAEVLDGEVVEAELPFQELEVLTARVADVEPDEVAALADESVDVVVRPRLEGDDRAVGAEHQGEARAHAGDRTDPASPSATRAA